MKEQKSLREKLEQMKAQDIEQWEKERAQITPEEKAQMKEFYERFCREHGFDPNPFVTGDVDTDDED